MIEDLIARVFLTRNLVHLEHWRTQSFSQHMALGEFYDNVVESIDTIVEAYQGAFELVGPVPVLPPYTGTMLDHLEEEVDWIEVNRDKISKRQTAVANLVDALIEDYLKVIYKLRNLK